MLNKVSRTTQWVTAGLFVWSGLLGCGDKDANSESHFSDDTVISEGASKPSDCPASHPFAFKAGDTILCSSDNSLTLEQANAALQQAGKAPVDKAPTLVCENTCDPKSAECTENADGCWEPKTMPDTCCDTDADCGGGACLGKTADKQGQCLTPPNGTCYGDLHCDTGWVCAVGAGCGCGEECAPTPGECVPDVANGCCMNNDDCTDGVCAPTGDGKGVCLPSLEKVDECWTANDCELGSTCEGAGFAKCELDSAAPQKGHCAPGNPASCCGSNEDCDGDLICVSVGTSSTCAPPPLAGQCWAEGDCLENQTCDDVEICSCVADCPAYVQGTCNGTPPLAEGCCNTTADCDDGSVCVDTGDGKGACELAAPDGKCWSSADCEGGEVCQDAQTCPCDLDCDNVEPGTCTSVSTDCKEGFVGDLTGVSIHFEGAPCSFTVAQAAAGIEIPYQIVVSEAVSGVIAVPQDAGHCGQPGPSGLIPFTRLSGNDQNYCICDTGLCQGPSDEPVTLVVGSHAGAFNWDGVNWAGPSDTGNPKGEPFPPGTYQLSVSAKGTVDGVAFEIEGTLGVQITP